MLFCCSADDLEIYTEILILCPAKAQWRLWLPARRRRNVKLIVVSAKPGVETAGGGVPDPGGGGDGRHGPADHVRHRAAGPRQ